MNQAMLIKEHDNRLHEDPRIRQSRLGRCPKCSPEITTDGGDDIVRETQLEAELRATRYELEQLRASASPEVQKPRVRTVGGGIGAAFELIMARRRAQGLTDHMPDGSSTLEETSEFDGGSLCVTCGGYRWRTSGANLGEPGFGELYLCQECPEGRAMGSRKTALPSGVPTEFVECRFETYPVTDASRPGFEAVRAWVDALIAGDPGRPMFYLSGPFGVGKSSLSAACVFAWEEATGGRGLWITANELLDRIRAGYDPSTAYTADEVVERVKTTRFLAIDDLGVERVTPWVVEKLFDLINSRHNNALPTIFTSNLSLRQLADHLNAGTPADLPQPGERIMWRIISSATCQTLVGPNLHNPTARMRLIK